MSMLGFLGLLLLYIGLARTGVVGWWATGVYVVALVGMFTALFAPLAVVGIRAARRARTL
ncbi:hypothetical protein [Actinoplanes sp. NPDC049316]|uniref:hypothetical protein n=1 Tax=Actinoplanes sp. NPDC049316 TaxID=3154727 RepID=UPI00341CC386